MLLIALIGCGGPGKVGPPAYDYAKAIYSLANRRASDRIDTVAEQINADAAASKLTEHEVTLLNHLLDDCRAGEWQSAGKAARAIMEDQVER